MEVSIIIPTYNRAAILDKCLSRIANNEFPKNKYEILVIDDSSTDNTSEIVQKHLEKNKNIKYFRQKKSGQGVARNLGIAESNGNILIFIGDDILVTKNFIKEHYEFHQINQSLNESMLGLILWDPEVKITDYMKWSTHELTFFGHFGGHQFAFNNLEKGKTPNYNYFYTSNISLKKEILQNNKFDPWFEGYGWEDIELAYRLEKELNLHISYNHNALAYHHHHLNDKDLKHRMTSIGKAALKFQQKHPELNIIPSGIKLTIFKIISNSIFVFTLKLLNKLTKNFFIAVEYYALSKKYYLEGININNN